MSEQHTITIPAKVGNQVGVESRSVSGRVFACISATGEFFVRADQSDKISARKGSTFGNPGARRFDRLTFYNVSAASIVVTFFAGDEDYRPNTPLDDDGAGVPIVIVPSAASPAHFVKPVPAAGTPVALAAVETFFRKATIVAYKTLARGANTGNVFLGVGAAVNEQPFVLEPGDERTLEAPLGQKWNLEDWYLDAANNNDAVVVIYS